jgi:hypothetical protein
LKLISGWKTKGRKKHGYWSLAIKKEEAGIRGEVVGKQIRKPSHHPLQDRTPLRLAINVIQNGVEKPKAPNPINP